MVFSGIAIGFMGWGVWAHHMFASGIGPDLGGRLLAVDDVHRRADRREDPQLAGHHVGRQAAVHDADAVRRRPGRACSPSAACRASPTPSSPADTQQTDTYYIVAHFHYVLFGGALLRLLRRLLLLVAEGLRPPAQREARQVALLADAHRLQPDVRPDAHPRPAGHAPPHPTPTPRATASTSGTWSRPSAPSSSPCRCSCSSCNIVVSYRRPQAPTRSMPGPDPWDARSLEWMIPSPTPDAQLRRDPDRHPPRRVLAPQVRRGRATAGSCASPPPRTSPRRATPPDVHLPSPSYWPHRARLRPAAHRLRPDLQPLAVPSSAALVVLAGIYGWVLEPPVDPEAATTTATTTTTADEPTATAPRRRRRRRRRRRARRRSLTDDRSRVDAGADGRRPPAPTTAHGDRAIDADARPTAHATNTGISNEKLGDVGVPRLGVPALRRPDLDLPALQAHGRRRRPDARTTSTTSRSRRVSSFVLLMSSLTMVLAVGRHRPGRPPPRAARGCSPPPCSAPSFISGQVYEFTVLREGGPGLHHQPASARPSTRSPASTAST